MSRFLNTELQSIKPYVPGEQPKDMTYIKLNTNESPYPPSPKVIEALSVEETAKLRLYSDPDAWELVNAICDVYGVKPDQVLVGNGSDEVLAFSFLAFQHEHGICFPSITYGFYPVFAELFQISTIELPLNTDFSIDLDGYRQQAGTVLLANPNAPTGKALDRDVIETLVRENPDRLVIIDEAYVDFGAESCVPLVGEYDNLLVVQTCSKSRSLAGGRIGFAIGNKSLIEDLNKIKYSFNPYNVNRLSILAGAAAMRDVDYFTTCTNATIQIREEAAARLKQVGFQVVDSRTNFLFAKPPGMTGKQYLDGLRKKGILVRHWEKAPIDEYVRITIGTKEQMETLYQATAEILGEL